MRTRFVVALLVAVFGYIGYSAWRTERLPALPHPHPALADLGVMKSDLFVYARAERAFYGSTGRYASMHELRSAGLITLPPDTRWPYRYTIVVPDANTFLIVAMSQGPVNGRLVAFTIDDKMDVREFNPHPTPDRPHNRRSRSTRRTSFL
jgi:hypothetical protein